ncbi:hypothetical protein L1887_55841 [Cichorium endivia]|nr:hypothetical protein L1887_55841 [Cichorium endivia]
MCVRCRVTLTSGCGPHLSDRHTTSAQYSAFILGPPFLSLTPLELEYGHIARADRWELCLKARCQIHASHPPAQMRRDVDFERRPFRRTPASAA